MSELRKARTGKADKNVAAWAAGRPAASMFVSAVTIQELEIGVLLAERRDPRQGVVLRRWLEELEEYALPTFAERVIPVDTAVARCSAALHVPEPRPVRDTLIAATALVHRMSVVTRDAADFAPTGAVVINPWDGSDRPTDS